MVTFMLTSGLDWISLKIHPEEPTALVVTAKVNGNKISELEKVLCFLFIFFFHTSYRSLTHPKPLWCWPKTASNLESIFWNKVMVWYIQRRKKYEIFLFRDKIHLMRINSNLIRHKTYHFGPAKIFQLRVIKMRFISIAILRKSILGTCLKHFYNAKNYPEACGEPGWEQNPSTHQIIKWICAARAALDRGGHIAPSCASCSSLCQGTSVWAEIVQRPVGNQGVPMDFASS